MRFILVLRKPLRYSAGHNIAIVIGKGKIISLVDIVIKRKKNIPLIEKKCLLFFVMINGFEWLYFSHLCMQFVTEKQWMN